MQEENEPGAGPFDVIEINDTPQTLTELLQTLIDHIENPAPLRRWGGVSGKTRRLLKTLLSQALISAASVGGAWVYAEPAKDYANSEDALLVYRSALLAALGTCAVAAAALYVSMDIFLTMQSGQTVPEELLHLLEKGLSGLTRRIKNRLLVMGAIASSLQLRPTKKRGFHTKPYNEIV